MAEYLPKTDESLAWKVVATGAITGGLMVTTAGATAGANSATWLGIAARDAAVGETVTVYLDDIQRPIAAGAINVGDRLKCAAAGQLTVWVSGTDAADLFVGIALEAGTAGNKFAAKFIR
ncbi:hypothetical protein GCM10028801_41170 [Nocardioides maradonensis]